jgi:mannose-6-phosphate isomerase-like protein (cupin superfamily)
VTTIFVEPDGGERIHWPQQGHDFVLKITSENLGSFSLTEAVIPPGKGAGLHVHEASEECWYVLEGEYRFTVGDTEFTAGPGATVLVPRGTPHGIQVGETGGRNLTIFAPGGCEIAFREIGAAQQSGTTGPDFWRQLGERTSTRFNVG